MRFRRNVTFLLACAILLGGVVASAHAAKGGGSKPPSSSPVITGVVRQADSQGSVIQGALVSVSQVTRKDALVLVGAVETGEDGAFKVPVSKTGDYVIDVSAPGYLSSSRRITVTRSVAYVEFGLIPAVTTISGTAYWDLSHFSSTLPDISGRVAFYRRAEDGTWPAEPEVEVALKADAPKETYVSPDLAPGTYWVAFESPQYLTYEAGQFVIQERGQRITGVDGSFSSLNCESCHSGSSTISGTFGWNDTHPEGPLAPGAARIAFYLMPDDGSEPTQPQATVDLVADRLSETWTSPGLPLGVYRVVSEVAWQEPDTIDYVRLSYRGQSETVREWGAYLDCGYCHGSGTGTISGRVNWDFGAFHFAWVGMTHADVSFYRVGTDGRPSQEPEAVVRASFPGEERYVSPELPLGEYVVVFDGPEYLAESLGPVSLTHRGQQLTGVDTMLSRLDCAACHPR